MAVSGGALVSWAGTAAGAGTIASAAVGVATAAYGASQQRAASREARADAERGANAQKNAQEEQKAQAAAQQADARRAQIREERVRRARILQSSENAGSTDSSGAVGAQAGLSTNLQSNLGRQAGAALSGERQSSYLQQAADFDFARQANQARAATGGAIAQQGFNIFQKAVF